MKNLKKVFAVATAIAALSASMTAFAEKSYTPTGDLGFTYDKETNSITVTSTDFAKSGTEMTLLVLKSTANETNVGQDDILYIDQDTKGTTASFQNMGLKGTIADLVDGSYPVKLGYYDATSGEFAIKAGTLTVAEAATGGKTVEIVWGDVNADGAADTLDATAIITAYIGGKKTFGANSEYEWGKSAKITVTSETGVTE
ncbi:MAG: hypothetical protein PUB42_07680 [Firmicutes bacterium]|nr:hypothetical protein [Bacillota bacterium]